MVIILITVINKIRLKGISVVIGTGISVDIGIGTCKDGMVN